ncbi:MAG: hypothetical protein R3B70_35210 [Polyangiaceae bacterium]
MGTWTADVGNDPNQDFDLCIELMEDGEYRGKLQRDLSGTLQLTVYPAPKGVVFPVDWLLSMMNGAREEL